MTKKEFLAKEFRPTCPDCGVGVGTPHVEGCDVQRCTGCKGQRFACYCGVEDEETGEVSEDNHDPQAAAWTGYWPGVEGCVERGWFSKLVPGRGWQPTTIDDPDASCDLNRYVIEVFRGNASW